SSVLRACATFAVDLRTPPTLASSVNPTRRSVMATIVKQEPDAAAVEEFIGRGISDIAGAMTTIFCIVGDRLGLFQGLDEGPATAAELAERTGIDERYALEWLRGLASAGYLEESGDRYLLPPAHAVVLAREGNPMFVGGAFQELGGMLPALERIIEAFRVGGGVPQAAYSDDAYAGMARFTSAWFDHYLLGAWLPLLPVLRGRLEQGIRWADVGCGAGRAVIRLVQAFPHST